MSRSKILLNYVLKYAANLLVIIPYFYNVQIYFPVN